MTSIPGERSRWKEALCQLAAGGFAGFIEVSLMHPLDLIKIRMQVEPTLSPSIITTFRTIVRTEGALSLYKGIAPALLQDTPRRASRFLCFEQYKRLFAPSDRPPAGAVLAAAGACAGLTEAVVMTPFEVVKVRLQTETRVRFKEQMGASAVTKQILQEGGFGTLGLYKGLTATLGRHGMFSGVYFGFYHNVKDSFPPLQNPLLEFAKRFVIGFAGGSLASILNLPFDVAKSRIQGPQPSSGSKGLNYLGDPIKYLTCFDTMTTVAREEGWKALYRGLVPKVLRLGPGGAIMLLVYEYSFAYLEIYLL